MKNRILNTTIAALAAVFFVLPPSVQAQVTAISPDNSYFAVSYQVILDNDDTREGLNIYNFNGRHIKYFELEDFDCEKISGLYFVNKNKNIFLQSHCSYMGSVFEQYSLWNVEEKNKITSFKAASENEIDFSDDGNLIAIRRDNSDFIELYDTKKGRQIDFFEFKKGGPRKLSRLEISANNRLILLDKKENQDFIILNRDDKKKVEEIEAQNILFINMGRELQVFYENGEIERLETTKYKTKNTLKAPEYSSGFEKAIASPDGSFTAIPDLNKVLIIDNQRYTKFHEVKNTGNIKNIEFADNNTLIIDEDKGGRIIDLKKKQQIANMDYEFIAKNDEPKIELGEQINERILSPDRKFAAYNYNHTTGNIIFFKESSGKSHVTIPDYKLISFSADSKYAFIENNKQQVGLVKSNELAKYAKDIDFSFKPLVNPALMDEEEYARYQQKEQDKLERKKLIENNQLKTEELIQKDNPPKSFKYSKVEDFMHISKANVETLQINLRNVVADPKATKINVHLMDDKGNYYYGAGNNHKIWNKLSVKYPDGTTKELKDYQVIEHTANDSTPCAVILILDHSGSMGEERALMLQEGVENVIKRKRPQDGMAIIKYDSWIGTEAKINKDKEVLLSLLQKNGLEGYGAQTAIYDAIDEGRFLLRNVGRKYNKRSIFILTDGNENASKISKNKALANVIKRGINVYTIGYGRRVSRPELQSIAYSTGGAYYQIYSSDDLKWIYEDVYNKSLSYYTIKFKSTQTGKHVAKIDVHYNNKFQDELIVAYDNSERKLDDVNPEKEDAFGVPLMQVPAIEQKKKKFASNELMEEQSDLISATKSNLDVVINHEFKAIDFPDVQFYTNTAKIVEGTETGLEEVIDFMQVYPESEIEIEGHTDNAGTHEFNMKLSEKRANTIKETIVKRAGISADRIKVTGYGETQPLDTNETEKGRAKNRRVVFKLLKL